MYEIKSIKETLRGLITPAKIEKFSIKFAPSSLDFRLDDSVYSIRYATIQRAYLDGDDLVLFRGVSVIRLQNEIIVNS